MTTSPISLPNRNLDFVLKPNESLPDAIFNTFRLDNAWSHAVRPGDVVTVRINGKVAQRAVVVASHVDSLGRALERHGRYNHATYGEKGPVAQSKLRDMLARIYPASEGMPVKEPAEAGAEPVRVNLNVEPDTLYTILYLAPVQLPPFAGPISPGDEDE